jgi:hypothetical protein
MERKVNIGSGTPQVALIVEAAVVDGDDAVRCMELHPTRGPKRREPPGAIDRPHEVDECVAVRGGLLEP